MKASAFFREASKVAKTYGFHLHRKNRHLVWRNDNGVQVVCAQTPSCHHALANFRSTCRRLAS